MEDRMMENAVDFGEEAEEEMAPMSKSKKAAPRKKQGDHMSEVLFKGSKFTSKSMPSQAKKKK